MSSRTKKREPEEGLSELIERMKETSVAAISLYAPKIAAVSLRFEKGEQVSEGELERLLDGVLDFCFDSKMVELFRKLCRVAVMQYPETVNEYVLLFRDLWGV